MSQAERLRIVVLGGAGNFGARIVRALCSEPGVQLIAAGRRAVTVPGAPDVPTAVVDIDHPDLAAQLEALAPDLVIHCAGPFQTQDYRVAQAALAAGSHYLDLADGREFVAGFANALNAMALHHGRTAITGASTLPGLSIAVIDAITAEFTTIESIQIVIAPGQLAPRGTATLAAVFTCLGKPIALWRAGLWQTGWGWMGLRRFDLGFGKRWGALCDVPDLALLPARYRGLQSAAFHAALEIRVQHLVLWTMAALRRVGVPLPVQKWARPLDRLASMFDSLGGKWGGMQVQVVGSSTGGARIHRSWTLRAPVMNGPEIPCMAAILLARRLAKGEQLAAGAFSCVGFLKLAEFAPLFARLGITTHCV
ncbi:MAG: saccharopine dehydrogenase NADP-binding domain-containing protein [Pseudomonadota bacterium]